MTHKLKTMLGNSNSTQNNNEDINTVVFELKPNTVSKSCFSQFISFLTIKNNNLALGVLCVCALMQNIIIGGANNAVLTTIERAYFMTSIESALFLSLYDVANIFASPIIGYFGDRTYKPKIIAFSMIGLSIGSFIMIIPEFAMSSVQADFFYANGTDFSKDQVVCIPEDSIHIVGSNKTITIAPKLALLLQTPSSSKTTNYLMNKMKYIFYFSNMVNGASSVALYTIVISYIESIFSKEQAHMRQGIFYAIGAIGVGIGMLITGNFLNLNGVPHKKSPKKYLGLNSNSVNWIGAWWIIYAITAIINALLSVLVFRFAPSLILNKESSEGKTKSNLTSLGHLKQFFRNAILILANRVFLFIVICTTFETFLIKGFSSYLTKYLEYQYRLPASTATMIAGAIGFISLVFGPLSGAYLIKRFSWSIKQCAKFVVLILFLTSLLFLGLIVHCPQEKYINEESKVYQNSDCNCDVNTFYPVCYKNSYIFQTPCHAGCTKFTRPNIYSKCMVLELFLKNEYNDSTALLPCQRPTPYCISNLVLVSLIGLAVLFLSSIVILPVLRIILESINVENQSFALGIRSLITKLLGLYYY